MFVINVIFLRFVVTSDAVLLVVKIWEQCPAFSIIVIINICFLLAMYSSCEKCSTFFYVIQQELYRFNPVIKQFIKYRLHKKG